MKLNKLISLVVPVCVLIVAIVTGSNLQPARPLQPTPLKALARLDSPLDPLQGCILHGPACRPTPDIIMELKELIYAKANHYLDLVDSVAPADDAFYKYRVAILTLKADLQLLFLDRLADSLLVLHCPDLAADTIDYRVRSYSTYILEHRGWAFTFALDSCHHQEFMDIYSAINDHISEAITLNINIQALVSEA